MKKISMLLSMIIALAMFVMPMGAMAEPTTAQVIQIANPVIYMDGEEMARLDGLAAQLAYCEGSDVAQFIFDVFVGGQNANSAMIQIDGDTNVVGIVGGMSNAYTVNISEVAQMFMSAMAAESGIDMAQIENIVYMAENWTLPEDVMNVIAMHEGDFTITDLGVSNNVAGVPMQYIQITGDLIPVVFDVLRVIDNDALINEIMELLYPGMGGLGITEAISGVNVNAMVDITLGVDETGNLIEGTLVLTLMENGQAVTTLNAAISVDASDPSCIFFVGSFGGTDSYGDPLGNYLLEANIGYNDFTCRLSGNDAYGDPIEMNIAAGISGDALNFSLDSVVDGETVDFDAYAYVSDLSVILSLKGSAKSEYSDVTESFALDFNGSMTENGYGFTLDMNTDGYSGPAGVYMDSSFALTDTEATMDLTIIATEMEREIAKLDLDLCLDSNFNFEGTLTAQDEYSNPVTIGINLTTMTPVEGAYYSGKLGLLINDGYNQMEANADVHLLTADVDTDSFYISPAAAINIMTMDDAQYNTAMSELEAIFNQLGTMIMETYPAVFGY